jgi:hypothetical protein
MEPRYGALYGALEQLASDRRSDLQASARARRLSTRHRRRRLPTRRWLAQAIGLRPATTRTTSATCTPRSA